MAPVRSGYGVHAVRVDARDSARLPGLEAIRPIVAQDWIEAERQRLREAAHGAMRSGYAVVLPEGQPGGDGGTDGAGSEAASARAR